MSRQESIHLNARESLSLSLSRSYVTGCNRFHHSFPFSLHLILSRKGNFCPRFPAYTQSCEPFELCCGALFVWYSFALCAANGALCCCYCCLCLPFESTNPSKFAYNTHQMISSLLLAHRGRCLRPTALPAVVRASAAVTPSTAWQPWTAVRAAATLSTTIRDLWMHGEASLKPNEMLATLWRDPDHISSKPAPDDLSHMVKRLSDSTLTLHLPFGSSAELVRGKDCLTEAARQLI